MAACGVPLAAPRHGDSVASRLRNSGPVMSMYRSRHCDRRLFRPTGRQTHGGLRRIEDEH